MPFIENEKGAECPFLRYESFSGYTDTGFDGHISKCSFYFRTAQNGGIIKKIRRDFKSQSQMIYFGCPWYKDSNAEYGLLSRSYLDGPGFEKFRTGLEKIRFLWLIPITER